MARSEPEMSSGQQRVWLAVLGKHPGWNDHLDDIGLDTDRLVAVKRQLYVDGIGGLINAGTWEAMPEAERDEGFGHTFFWRQPDGMVVGRMWSSSDGKGRRKYPMIACALCRSLPFSFVAGPVLDRLRRLESACVSADSAAAVIAATDASRKELTDVASFAPELGGGTIDASGGGAAAQLIASGTLGEDGVGLRRVLYQVEREMGAYIRPDGSGTASRSRSVEIRGQMLRVPAPDGAFEPGVPPAGVGLWCRLMLTRIDPLVPMLFVCKDGRPWIDIVVGEPGPTQLAGLQTNTTGLPFASDIPFTIDPETTASFDAMIEASRRGDVGEKDPCYVDVPEDRLAPFLRPRRSEPASTEGPNRTKLYAIVAAVTLAVVLVILMIVMAGGGSGGSNGSGGTGDSSRGEIENSAGDRGARAETSKIDAAGEGVAAARTTGDADSAGDTEDVDTAPPSIDAVAVSGGADETIGDPAARLAWFVAWCDAYEKWYQPFAASLDVDALGSDPRLAQRVSSGLAAVASAGEAVDPLITTPGRFRSMESLRDTPPDAIYEDDFGSVIRSGIGPLLSLRAALAEDRWPARRGLGVLLERAQDAGGAAPESLRQIQAALAGDDGASAAAATVELVSIASRVIAASDGLAAFDASDTALRASGAVPVEVSAAFAMLDPVPARNDLDAEAWLDAIERDSEAIAAIGRRTLSAAEGALARVDPGLLGERMASVGDAGDAETAAVYLDSWVAAVNDKSLYLLDPSLDPRQALPDPALTQNLRSALARLTREGENAETRELGGMLDAAAQALDDLTALSWNEATRTRVEGETEETAAVFRAIEDRLDAEMRLRAVQAESYIAELRATASVDGSRSEALGAAWTDRRDRAISAFESDSDVVKLSRTIDEAKSFIASADAAMPAVEVSAEAFGAAFEEVSGAISVAREAMLAEVCSRGEIKADAERAYGDWAEGVRRGEAALAGLRQCAEAWMRSTEPADGGTADGFAAQWEASWPAKSVSIHEVDAGLGVYCDAVHSDDLSRVSAIAGDDSSPPAAVWAAWSRLSELDAGWGGSVEQAGLDRDAATRVLRQAPTELSGERAGVVVDAARALAADRWVRSTRAMGPESFSMLARNAADMGIDLDRLPADQRFNLFVERMRLGLEGGDAFDRAALLDQIRAEQDSLGDAASAVAATSWLKNFADELEAREGREVDYRVIGPARAGWTVEPYDAGRVLVYSWMDGDEPRRLRFRLVESPDAGVFYLSETEVPVWLLTEYGLGGAHAADIAARITPDWDPLPDTRLGPSVWTWGRTLGGRGIRLSRTWVAVDRTGDRPFYPEGTETQVGRPSEEHPIQRVSAAGAAVLAAATGCRLPTEAEWRAAHASVGSPSASDAWNLRDAAFDRQRAHTVSLGAGVSVTWPEQQSFVDGMDGVRAGPAAESYGWSDGTLWFETVGSGRDRPFRHLLGNVAEFVLPGLDDQVLLTDRGGSVADRVRAVAGSFDARPLGLAVIGGSALSAPSIALERGSVPPDAERIHGFTDVGFRLAFSPGVEAPLVVVVGGMVEGAPYLRFDE